MLNSVWKVRIVSGTYLAVSLGALTWFYPKPMLAMGAVVAGIGFLLLTCIMIYAFFESFD